MSRVALSDLHQSSFADLDFLRNVAGKCEPSVLPRTIHILAENREDMSLDTLQELIGLVDGDCELIQCLDALLDGDLSIMEYGDGTQAVFLCEVNCITMDEVWKRTSGEAKIQQAKNEKDEDHKPAKKMKLTGKKQASSLSQKLGSPQKNSPRESPIPSGEESQQTLGRGRPNHMLITHTCSPERLRKNVMPPGEESVQQRGRGGPPKNSSVVVVVVAEEAASPKKRSHPSPQDPIILVEESTSLKKRAHLPMNPTYPYEKAYYPKKRGGPPKKRTVIVEEIATQEKITPVNGTETEVCSVLEVNSNLAIIAKHHHSPVGHTPAKPPTVSHSASVARVRGTKSKSDFKSAFLLSDDKIRAIFDCVHSNSESSTDLQFQIVPGIGNLKLSPPPLDFEVGLYILLPPKAHKVPSNLTHCIMKFEVQSLSGSWTLSGPQLKPTPNSFQQRYAYPKNASSAYGKSTGATMFTMIGADGREDTQYRLLHVYHSSLRSAKKTGIPPEEPSSPSKTASARPTNFTKEAVALSANKFIFSPKVEVCDTRIRAIFDYVQSNGEGTTDLQFQIVPGIGTLKLSPPSLDFEVGLYVLLAPKVHKISSNLMHCLMEPEAPSPTRGWNLSGPQLKAAPNSIQQRYAYPKNTASAYGKSIGATMFTMIRADGKEDTQYRLLHVYCSMLRSVNQNVLLPEEFPLRTIIIPSHANPEEAVLLTTDTELLAPAPGISSCVM